jgi:hypothetical protein
VTVALFVLDSAHPDLCDTPQCKPTRHVQASEATTTPLSCRDRHLHRYEARDPASHPSLWRIPRKKPLESILSEMKILLREDQQCQR